MDTTHPAGIKYAETRELDITAVAKLIRKDIKAAQETGAITADAKVSVRCSRYSLGQSIDVTVTVPGLPRWPSHLDVVEHSAPVKAIVAQYNYDNSDFQSDYFETRFNSHVTVEGMGR